MGRRTRQYLDDDDEPELTLEDVCINKADHNRRNSNSSDLDVSCGSWGYSSVERRLDLNLSLDFGQQESRMERTLQRMNIPVPADVNTTTKGDNHHSELSRLSKKRETFKGVVDSLEEELVAEIANIRLLNEQYQQCRSHTQQRKIQQSRLTRYAIKSGKGISSSSSSASSSYSSEDDNASSASSEDDNSTDESSVSSSESTPPQRIRKGGKSKRVVEEFSDSASSSSSCSSRSSEVTPPARLVESDDDSYDTSYSSDATPPPPPPRRRKGRKSKRVVESDDDSSVACYGSDDATPPRRFRKGTTKSKKKKKNMVESDDDSSVGSESSEATGPPPRRRNTKKSNKTAIYDNNDVPAVAAAHRVGTKKKVKVKLKMKNANRNKTEYDILVIPETNKRGTKKKKTTTNCNKALVDSISNLTEMTQPLTDEDSLENPPPDFFDWTHWLPASFDWKVWRNEQQQQQQQQVQQRSKTTKSSVGNKKPKMKKQGSRKTKMGDGSKKTRQVGLKSPVKRKKKASFKLRASLVF